ncbi:YycH family regulatory protein [Loigolactobacillus rennini]|nr:two-component system activity regulator YycH [Loigolactobacillus rennini]
MKIRHLLLKLSLVIMVIISLVLSWLIWTNNARFQRDTTDVATPKTQTTSKNVNEVYLPTQLLTSNETGAKYLVYNNKENLIDALHKKMTKWRFARPQKMNFTSKSYLAAVNQADAVSLVYPHNISYGVFGKAFKQKVARVNQQRLFNRIILPAAHADTAYFLNDQHKTGFKVTLRHADQAAIQARLKKTTMRLPVTEKWFNNRLQMYFLRNVKVTQYSYLVTKQSPTTFVTSLLGGDPSALETKEQKDLTTYSDGTYKNLAVDHRKGTVDFEDYSKDIARKTPTVALTNGHQMLNKIGNTPGNMRYFDYETKTHTMVYRSYVEGLPVFNQTDFGAVKVQLLKNGVKLNFSLYALQVPLPADKAATPLPTTQTALDRLSAAGYDLTKITGIKLGYHWGVNASSSSVIDLTPTYYYHYNGKWVSFDQLLNPTSDAATTSEERAE